MHEQATEVQASECQSVAWMGFLGHLDLFDNALHSEKPDHVSNVVGAHAQLRILRAGLTFDGRWLKRFRDRFDNRGPVPIAALPVQGPIDLGKVILKRIKRFSHSDLLLNCDAEIGEPVDTVLSCWRIKAPYQAPCCQLTEGVTARVLSRASVASDLDSRHRLAHVHQSQAAVLALLEPVDEFCVLHSSITSSEFLNFELVRGMPGRGLGTQRDRNVYQRVFLAHRMWNEPTDTELRRLPGLYATENTPAAEKIIHEHFFLGGCDWWMAEYDPRSRTFFGYANLGDPQNAEWGYIDFDELRDVRTPQGIEVDRDLHWKPQRARDIDGIRCR